MSNPRLQKLRESNQDRDAALRSEGAMLHPLTLMDAKLDALIEHFSCHLKLEEQIASRLDTAEEQHRQAKLMAGLHLPTFGKEAT